MPPPSSSSATRIADVVTGPWLGSMGPAQRLARPMTSPFEEKWVPSLGLMLGKLFLFLSRRYGVPIAPAERTRRSQVAISITGLPSGEDASWFTNVTR